MMTDNKIAEQLTSVCLFQYAMYSALQKPYDFSEVSFWTSNECVVKYKAFNIVVLSRDYS